jgi:thiamine biosynthesis lipoprotein
MQRLIIALLCLMAIMGCRRDKMYFVEQGSVFHTLYSIKYEAAKSLSVEIEAEFEAFNLSLNPFNPNSIISKVNKNEAVEADEWFVEVFNKAQEISAQSGGAFDATAAPLINLWGFGFNKYDSLSNAMVDSIKSFVGYKKIRLDGRKIVKDDPRVMLNFSAIAKGYAVDVIAGLLERNGVENYMVDIGGEEKIKGVNSHGVCWRIGIKKPSDDPDGTNRELEDTVQPCRPCGIATSGDYRNFYEKDGKRYAHTINPATGYPAAQNLLSATVLADNCMEADGWATAFMVLGAERAVETARNISGIEYFFIYTDEQGNYRTVFSEGMRAYLSKH